MPLTMADVPTLDLAVLSDEANPQHTMELGRLTDALSEHGFVKLINHGLAEADVQRMFEWVSRASPLNVQVASRHESSSQMTRLRGAFDQSALQWKLAVTNVRSCSHASCSHCPTIKSRLPQSSPRSPSRFAAGFGRDWRIRRA